MLGQLAGLRRPVPSRKARAVATKMAAAVREHLPTIAALAAVDLGSFEACRPAGWIVAGVSVLLLEWKVRG